jgi:hypothetical protein
VRHLLFLVLVSRTLQAPREPGWFFRLEADLVAINRDLCGIENAGGNLAVQLLWGFPALALGACVPNFVDGVMIALLLFL